VFIIYTPSAFSETKKYKLNRKIPYSPKPLVSLQPPKEKTKIEPLSTDDMVVYQNPSGSYTAVFQPTSNSGTILKVNSEEPIFQEGVYSLGNWHDNQGNWKVAIPYLQYIVTDFYGLANAKVIDTRFKKEENPPDFSVARGKMFFTEPWLNEQIDPNNPPERIKFTQPPGWIQSVKNPKVEKPLSNSLAPFEPGDEIWIWIDDRCAVGGGYFYCIKLQINVYLTAQDYYFASCEEPEDITEEGSDEQDHFEGQELPQLEIEFTYIFPEIAQFGDVNRKFDTSAGTISMNPLSGSFEVARNDVSIHTKGGLALNYSRYYNSILKNPSPRGYGWHNNLEQRLFYELDSLRVSLIDSIGNVHIFSQDLSEDLNPIPTYTSPDSPGLIVENKGTEFVLTKLETGEKIHFGFPSGRIKYITSAKGGKINYIYPAPNEIGNITAIEDDYSKRRINFTYDEYERITSVTDPCGRMYSYEYSQNGDLIKVYNPLENYVEYTYDLNHNITKVKTLNGAEYNVEYIDPIFGRAFTLSNPCSVNPFGINGGGIDDTIILQDEIGIQTVFQLDNYCNVLSVDYPGERTVQYIYDSLGCNNISVVYPSGNSILYEYNDITEKGKLTETKEKQENPQNPEGESVIGSVRFEYEANGKITKIIDQLGNETIFRYDENGLLRETEDSIGRKIIYHYDSNLFLTSVETPYIEGENAITSYEYDEVGYCSKVIDPLGKEKEIYYDPCGNKIKYVYPDGQSEEFDYDPLNRVVEKREISSTGRVRTFLFEYDVEGNVTKFTDALGNVTQFEYDLCNRLKKVIDPLLNETIYEMDPLGRVNKIIDPKGRTIQNGFNEMGQISEITDEFGLKTKVNYNADNQISYIEDNLGRRRYIDYKYGRAIKVTDEKNNMMRLYYNLTGEISKMKDPVGNITEFFYDSIGRPIRVKNAKGAESIIEYYPSSLEKKVTDPLGHETSFEYNKIGQATKVTDAKSNSTTIIYDEAERLSKIKDAKNNETTIQYDDFSLVKKVIDALDNEYKAGYDIMGNITSTIDPLGNTSTFEYNQRNELKSVTDPLNHKTEFFYDEIGNLIKTKDPLGNYYEVQYDEKNRPKKSISPLGFEWGVTYDSLGRISSSRDPLYKTTYFNYDEAGNLIEAIDPMSISTKFEYDANYNLTKLKAPGNANTEYFYDELNRLTSVKDPAGNETTFTYNAINIITEVNKPNGKNTKFQYDEVYNLTKVIRSDLTERNFEYDSIYNLTKLTDEFGSHNFSYDNIYRLTSYSDPSNFTSSYSYDAASRLTSLTDPVNGTTNFSYDSASRLTEITLQGSSEITFSYDANDRLTTSNLPNGATVTYYYDNDSRITEKKIAKGEDTIIDFTYNYNATGLITSYSDGVDSYSYIYDNDYRLTTSTINNNPETIVNYTFDERGNRLTKIKSGVTQTYIYSIYDRLLNIKEEETLIESFQYDAVGNMIHRTNSSGTTNYYYNDEGRITKVEIPKDGGGYDIIEYTYFGTGQRRSKKVNGNEIFYHYTINGLSCIKNSSGDVIISFNSSVINYNGSKYYEILNHRGDIVALLNSNGVKVASFKYDDYGNLVEAYNPINIPTPFLFSGAFGVMYDFESSLYFMNARYYDSKIGRFLNKDSIQMINMYSYCENDPINYIDPSGLERVITPPAPPSSPSDSSDVSGPSMSLAEAFGINFWDLLFDLPGTIKKILDMGLDPNMILGNTLYFAGLMYSYGARSTSNNEGSSSTTASVIGGCDGPPDIEVPNEGSGDKTLAVTITINGIKIRIYVSANGFGIAETDDPKGADIVKGLNNGFNWLKGQGYRFSVEEMQKFGTKLEDFYNKHYADFNKIFTDKTNTLTQFFKHAVVGWAIQKEIGKVQAGKPAEDTGEYDMMIGFWVSFWAEKTGYDIKLRSGPVSGPEGLETKIGLLDLTLIIKAIICKESSFDETASSSTGDYGLMQVNEENFKEIVKNSPFFQNMRGFFNKDWKKDPFLNIGAGVGELFHIMHGPGKVGIGAPMPTLAQWIGAVWTYGPHGEVEKGKESLKNFFKFLKIYTGTRFTGLTSEEWYKAWAKYAHDKWPKGGYPWPP